MFGDKARQCHYSHISGSRHDERSSLGDIFAEHKLAQTYPFPPFMSQTRKIITSVAFMRAAAVCPRFSCISLAERAVMIEVIC
jgi:hypothetical protein